MTDPIIIGIDTKTVRLAYCTLQGIRNKPDLVAYELKAATIAEKCALTRRHAYNLVRAYALTGAPVSVFIEEPMIGRNVRGSVQLAKIVGATLAGVQSVSYSRGVGRVDVYEVNNKTWKKEVTGNGNATKPQVATWAFTYWRHAFEGSLILGSKTKADDDLIDAAAICWYGMGVVRKSEALAPSRPSTLLKKKITR